MARLLVPGSDQGVWGGILNEYLSVVHNTDGTLRDGIVSSANLASDAVDATTLAANNAPASNQVLSYDGSALTWTTPVISVAGRTGTVTLTKSDVGLGSVDNTSDASKPVSTATQTALDTLATSGVSLSRWRNKLATSASTVKIVFIGDSTSDSATEAVALQNSLQNLHAGPGGQLEGMSTSNIIMRGVNGVTRATYFSTSSYLNTLIADNPDLVIYSLGINDVRTGATTESQLAAGITSDVTWLRTNLPNTDIVLRIPNSFTTDDVSANGFVVPNSSAQAYTDTIRNAYHSLAGVWPHVVVWNSQDAIFGRTCRTKANAQRLMKDQLHPSKGYGYPLIAEVLADLIGHEKAARYGAVSMMTAARGAFPYTLGDLVDRADNTSLGTASSGTAWSGSGLQIVSNRITAVSPISFGAAVRRSSRASLMANSV